MPPKLLLSAGHSADNYLAAFRSLGADPVDVYCPDASHSPADYDALVLCGGADIDPHYYNEDISGSLGIDLARDKAEFAAAKAFLEAKKPILGICRGHQLLNVLFGGSLYQHLDQASAHVSGEHGDAVHLVKATEDSLLFTLYGADFAVNSSHHQGIKTLGRGLVITATSQDGVVEAVAHESLPVFSVQWHPERLCFAHAREDSVDGTAILYAFLELCQKDKDERK